MTKPRAPTYIALLHFPVYDRNGKTVATAITNLDIHDLARSTRTFGLAAYYLVTPLERQRELARRIVGYWGDEQGPRAEALKTVRIASSLDEVVEEITREAGRPRVVATAARRRAGRELLGTETLRRQREGETDKPLLVLFGTGWGLCDTVIERCDGVLEPIVRDGGRDGRQDDYNHLSVRSAAAIILDRLFGQRGS